MVTGRTREFGNDGVPVPIGLHTIFLSFKLPSLSCFGAFSGQKITESSAMSKTPISDETQRLVICIGDIHGHSTKLQNLWSNLQSATDPSEFSGALVVFLGDYCDRGPDTRGVLDFLISLPSKHPNQTHVFLSGNHDFAFAAFVGALPPPPGEFRDTWKEYEESEEREGWYTGDGFEQMHLQGRRWAGEIKAKLNSVRGTEYLDSIYDAAPTFLSYGVPHGSSDLMKAVPDEHKKFLADMVWVHEEDDGACWRRWAKA